MFSLDEIKDIIDTSKKPLGIEEITKLLCKKYKIVFDYNYMNIIDDIIKTNSNIFRIKFNNEIEQTQKSKYLYVSDNKVFKHEYDVLNEIFGYAFSGFQKGGKTLKDGNFVWFPEVNKKGIEWVNTCSEDGKTWTETPITEKARLKCRKELEKNVRYIFVHEGNGYKFAGVFRQTEIDDNLKRTYVMIDDKVSLFNNNGPSMYYEPVNLLQWPMFEEVSGVGHKEYFLATKEMKIGDILLLYVGVQKKGIESGVYAVGKIIEAPAILEGYPGDYCNNKLSVLVEIIKFGNKCLISAKDFSKYTSNLRSVHKIDSSFYDNIKEKIK